MNSFSMTTLERWLLKRIAKRLVIQSNRHERNITEYYQIIRDAAGIEFYEDNNQTLDDFMLECFNKTRKANNN